MEILAIVLASLLSLGSSGGLVLDKVVGGKIRSQVISVEQQAVRIDNQPNYSAVQGKLSRVRLAHRGIVIKPGIKIAALDLESDPVAVKLAKLKLDSIDSLRESLLAPATGAARIELTEKDLNQALKSPQIRQRLQSTLNRLIARKAGSSNIAYELSNVSLNLRSNNRLQVSFKLARPRPNLNQHAASQDLEPSVRRGVISDFNSQNQLGRGTSQMPNRSRELSLNLELTLKIDGGKKIRILDPEGTVNGRPMSSRLLNGFAQGVSDRLNLDTLEGDGIIARILQLEISEDTLQLVGFVRLETKMP